MTAEQAIALFQRIYAMRDRLVYLDIIETIKLVYLREDEATEHVVVIGDEVIENLEQWEDYKRKHRIIEEGTISFAVGDRVEIEATGIVDSVSSSGCVVRVHGVLVPMVGTAMRKVE